MFSQNVSFENAFVVKIKSLTLNETWIGRSNCCFDIHMNSIFPEISRNSIYVYWSKVYKVFFQLDMDYRDCKNLPRRITFDKTLCK